MTAFIFRFFVLTVFLSIIWGCNLQAAKQTNQGAKTHSQPQYEKINIKGEDHKNGIFDISVQYGDDGIGWLAYSRVELPKFVETRIARSNDHGNSWTYVTTANTSEFGTFGEGDDTIDGIWRHETPSLLFDPQDKPDRRWKLYSQRVFHSAPYKKKSAMWGESWLEYRYARSPKGPWSDSIRLLSGKDGNAKININKLHKDLREMSFYNEIGSIAVDGNIYLTLDASTTSTGLGEWKKRKIILISSGDHGETWKYAGILTDYDDASHLGYLGLTGSSPARENGKQYLLITPVGKKGLTLKKGHDGTVVVEFEDISRAKLRRDKKGNLVVIKRFDPVLNAGGLSSYDGQNSAGGILFCQIDNSVKSPTAQFFKVFNTRQGILTQ